MPRGRPYKRYLKHRQPIPTRSRARYDLGEQNARHGFEEELENEVIGEQEVEDVLSSGDEQDNVHLHLNRDAEALAEIPMAGEHEQHSPSSQEDLSYSSNSGSPDFGNREFLVSSSVSSASGTGSEDGDQVLIDNAQNDFEEDVENEEMVDEQDGEDLFSSGDESGVRRDVAENYHQLDNNDNQIPMAGEHEQHSSSSQEDLSRSSNSGSPDFGNRQFVVPSSVSSASGSGSEGDHVLSDNARNDFEEEVEDEEMLDEQEEDLSSSGDESGVRVDAAENYRRLNNNNSQNARYVFEEELENEEMVDEPEEEDVFSSGDEQENAQDDAHLHCDGDAAEINCQLNNDAENPAALPEPPFRKLLHKIHNDNRGVINEPVLVSKNEMLLMALGLSIKDNQNHTQFLHMITLLNSLFGESVLPHSLHLLDQILNSNCGIRYHFYCPECYHYFGEKNLEVVRQVVCETEGCNSTTQIHDLTSAPFFITFDISIQVEYLLKDDTLFSNLKKPVEILNGRDPDSFTDIYDGASYKKFARSTACVLAQKILSFIFATDGSPCWKGSKNSIWPLQLTINELPPLIRMNNIILGGLWFGRIKPPMDLFLIPFITEIKSLSTHGMNIHLRNGTVCHIKAYIILCCVDSGARGPVQGLKTHSGYSSCNWCTHPGEWLDAVRFPVLPYVPQRRTHQGLKAQAEEYLNSGIVVDGVIGLSPLFGAPQMDVVEGMSVEYMHLVDLGVTRQFLYAWLSDSEEDWYIGSDAEVELMTGKIASLSPPIEVRRRPRTLKDRKFWNARELENWLLLYSVPVLTGVLDNKYLNHWKYFVQAVYLLLQTKVTAEDCRSAHILLSHFIVKTEQLYGKSMMTFNVHVLIHLPEHVLRWGPLQFSSAYNFEAGNGLLKSLIHSQRGVPQQIRRALSHRLALQILQSECSSLRTDAFFEKIKKKRLLRCYSVNDCHYVGDSKVFTPTDEEKWLLEEASVDYKRYVQYYKVIKDKIVYNISRSRSRKTDNKFVMLRDSRLLEIVKIVFSQASNLGFVIGKEIHCSSFCRFPTNLSDASLFMREVNFIDNDLQLVPINDLCCVCFMSSPVGNYITPMSNVMNVW